MTDSDTSTKGLRLELPKGLALEPVSPPPGDGLALELPMPPLESEELVGDGPTLAPWAGEAFVCEIDDLY